MQTGQEESGMITMNQSLIALVKNGLLDPIEAIQSTTMPEELSKALSFSNAKR
jgi:Tfp pilus assembly pilus retraction ATPase PilT